MIETLEKILIVEEELIVARDIKKTLEKAGYHVMGNVHSVEKAFAMIAEEQPSLVLIDIFLKGELTGIDLATGLNKKNIPFIYISANSNQQVLEAAKTTNPYGFIVKPFRSRDLLISLDIARYRFENDKKLQAQPVISITSDNIDAALQSAGHRQITESERKKKGFIGKSASMIKVFKLIEQVAPFDTSVLLTGETGTGKELAADYIFRHSSRKSQSFIKINCGAIPQDLVEIEFFGSEKGSYTGASERRIGKFEMADKGTILLDEIGEMPFDLQSRLLRVLQEKEIYRIGGQAPVKTDVRIIASTNKNLEKEVAEGRFRIDLYYRLLAFPITLPPLRERKEDIPLLLQYFLLYYSSMMGLKPMEADPSLVEQMQRYDWPGNIRELQYLVERSVILSKADGVLRIKIPGKTSGEITSDSQGESEVNEREVILDALKKCNYKISGKGGAAELLNLAISALTHKIKELKIKIDYK